MKLDTSYRSAPFSLKSIFITQSFELLKKIGYSFSLAGESPEIILPEFIDYDRSIRKPIN